MSGVAPARESHRSLGRRGWAVVAPGVVAGLVWQVVVHDTGYWQLGVFALGPDVALLLGVGRGLERGQLHPRAVPLYNALHHPLGPAILGLVAAVDVIGIAWWIAALAWGAHIAVDRVAGYGPRDRHGFQRIRA